ncbi:hypothetical protein Y695_03833 [Hydrogenophaga sp. T4]|nr:hypothetical protein Y695_03833 [Hydrogenophaga sp. T4]
MGSGAEVVAQDDVSVTAEATPETRAEAKGVSIGAGSVGASLATASTTSNVEARIDGDASISGDKLDVVAQRLVGASPTTPLRPLVRRAVCCSASTPRWPKPRALAPPDRPLATTPR